MRLYVVLGGLVAPALVSTYSLDYLLKIFQRNPLGLGQDGDQWINNNLQELQLTGKAVAPAKLGNTTRSQYLAAKTMVDEAMDEVEKLSRDRLASPSRNQYTTRPGRGGPRQNNRPPPGTTPRFQMTDELKAAASLVSRVEALNNAHVLDISIAGNQTFGPPLDPRAATGKTFWMENIVRKGSWPWGNNPKQVVFRNVKKFGAVGDGITDDTDAINKAIAQKDECSAGCYSSTTMGAITYFPPGTYLIKSSIEISYGMQVIGDANNFPTLKSNLTAISLA